MSRRFPSEIVHGIETVTQVVTGEMEVRIRAERAMTAPQ